MTRERHKEVVDDLPTAKLLLGLDQVRIPSRNVHGHWVHVDNALTCGAGRIGVHAWSVVNGDMLTTIKPFTGMEPSRGSILSRKAL